MGRLCINIKDDEKAAIVLKLLRELPFVEIEGDTGEKDKRIEKKQKGSLEDLFGLWEHRDISELATNMIEKYAKSHGLGIPDALIDATAICHSIELLTYNVKDFKFIDSLKLYDPTK